MRLRTSPQSDAISPERGDLESPLREAEGKGSGTPLGQASEISKLYPDPPVNLIDEPRWHNAIFGRQNREDLAALQAFLDANPNRLIRLYHGTAAKHPVTEKGLLPTTATRRNSLQSASGFVCLSIYPGMAEDFARMAYPGQPRVVYAVDIPIRDLLPDLDQLRNKRYWGEKSSMEIRDTLADSLAIGSGARVKGRISPASIGFHRAPESQLPDAKPTGLRQGSPQAAPKEPLPATPEAFRETWQGRGVECWIGAGKDHLVLTKVLVPKNRRGEGIGTAFMLDLCALADRLGLQIRLTPSTDFGATSVDRLKRFYRRFGFVENKGRYKDWTFTETMYRPRRP